MLAHKTTINRNCEATYETITQSDVLYRTADHSLVFSLVFHQHVHRLYLAYTALIGCFLPFYSCDRKGCFPD